MPGQGDDDKKPRGLDEVIESGKRELRDERYRHDNNQDYPSVPIEDLSEDD